MEDSNKKGKYDYVVKGEDGWKPVDSTGTTDNENKTGGTQAFTERGIWISGKAKIIEEELERVGKETAEGINKALVSGLGELSTKGEEIFKRTPFFKESRVATKSGGMIIGREKRVKGGRELVALSKTYPLQKDNYSKRLYMFMVYLRDKWQSTPLNSEGYLVVKNLSQTARDLSEPNHKTTPARVKEYIKQISYAYPYVTTIGKKGNKRRIETEYKQPFKVKIRQLIDDGTSIGEGFIPLKDYAELDNYPFDEVWIKPSRFIRNSLGRDKYGKDLPPEVKKRVEGLGNIFLPKESVKLALHLSDLAYKIYLYQISNTPYGVICYEKFIEYLGYRKQDVKDKGNKGIKQEVANALKELVEIGHLEYWRYKKDNDTYYWKYTNKWVKHKEFVKGMEKEGGYIGEKTVETIAELKKKLYKSKGF